MAIINGNEILFSSEINISDTLPQEKSVEATENGIVEVEPDEGYSLKKATVHVNVPILENKLASLIDGSITEITAEDLAGVTEIVDYALYNRSELKNITIPDTVTNIGISACEGCSKLETVIMSNNVTSISKKMFDHCFELKNITLPDIVTNIGERAFYLAKNLKELNIPDSVTSLYSSCFAGMFSVEELRLPEGITEIPGACFGQTTGRSSSTGECNIYLPSTINSFQDSIFVSVAGIETAKGKSTINLHFATQQVFDLWITTECSARSGNKLGIQRYVAYYIGEEKVANITMPLGCIRINGKIFPESIEVDVVCEDNIISIYSESCQGVKKISFLNNTQVPTLSSVNAFNLDILEQIQVPATLYDEWIASTNWAKLVDYIVAV